MPLEALSVLPVRPLLDAQHKRFADSVVGSNFSSNSLVRSNSECNLASNLRKRVRLGMNLHASIATTFLPHIAQIIRLSPSPKMIWIHAFAIIARVANNIPLRDFTLKPQISVAMRQHSGPAEMELSIPIPYNRALPFPTSTILLRNIAFKIIFGISDFLGCVGSVAGQTANFTCGFTPSPRMEGCAACGTVYNNSLVSSANHMISPLAEHTTHKWRTQRVLQKLCRVQP